MAQKPVYKKRIGDATAAALIAVAVLCDGFKIILFFSQVLPVVGEAMDFIISPFVSILEDLIEFGTMGASGAYNGPGALTNIGFTLMDFVISLVPEIDDAPLTTLTILFLIWRTRIQDKKKYEMMQKAANDNSQREQQEYQYRVQAAQAAVQRAANDNATRQYQDAA